MKMNMWNVKQSGERKNMQMDKMIFKVRYSMWKMCLLVNGVKDWCV